MLDEVQIPNLVGSRSDPIGEAIAVLRLEHGGRTQRSHPQKVVGQDAHDVPSAAAHVGLDAELVVPAPARPPPLEAGLLVGDDAAVGTFVGDGGVVFRRVGTEGLHFGHVLGQRAEGIDDDGQEGVAVRILGALPLELGGQIGLGEEAVRVDADVEGVGVIPSHELLLAGALMMQ